MQLGIGSLGLHCLHCVCAGFNYIHCFYYVMSVLIHNHKVNFELCGVNYISSYYL